MLCLILPACRGSLEAPPDQGGQEVAPLQGLGELGDAADCAAVDEGAGHWFELCAVPGLVEINIRNVWCGPAVALGNQPYTCQNKCHYHQ